MLFSRSGFTEAVIEEAGKNSDVLLVDPEKITEWQFFEKQNSVLKSLSG